MKRTHADGAAAVLVGVILSIGGVATWQAYQQWVALGEMGGHMGMSASVMHGTHPVWYVLGTILVAGVISGVYLVARDRIVSVDTQSGEPSLNDYESDTEFQTGYEKESEDLETPPTAEPEPKRPVLDLLPDDERRILQPVIDSPGLTQIALRDRSDFSKSKVSQTVTDLEKRGLLYREPQGRTYRVYPTEELTQNQGRSPPSE